MKNVYEVLRVKEIALARLRQEVAALRIAASLLDDDPRTGLTDEPDAGELAERVDVDNFLSRRPGRTGDVDVAGEQVRWGKKTPEGAVVSAARRISKRLQRIATPLSSVIRSVAESS